MNLYLSDCFVICTPFPAELKSAQSLKLRLDSNISDSSVFKDLPGTLCPFCTFLHALIDSFTFICPKGSLYNLGLEKTGCLAPYASAPASKPAFPM